MRDGVGTMVAVTLGTLAGIGLCAALLLIHEPDLPPCVAYRTHLQPTMIGKVMVLMPMKVCTQRAPR